MAEEVIAIAVMGEAGLDVFSRFDDANQKRTRYVCIATHAEGAGLSIHHKRAEAHPDCVTRALADFAGADFLTAPFALGVPAQYPRAQTVGAPFTLLLYLDFFRQWQLADQEISRVQAQLAQGELPSGPEISTALRLLLDFNRVAVAKPVVEAVSPHLLALAAAGKDDAWQNAGFALRMLGDLHMRADMPEQALTAYEAAIDLGDNANRRGLAIKAARAAGDVARMAHHTRAYLRKWRAPDWLDSDWAKARAPAGEPS